MVTWSKNHVQSTQINGIGMNQVSHVHTFYTRPLSQDHMDFKILSVGVHQDGPTIEEQGRDALPPQSVEERWSRIKKNRHDHNVVNHGKANHISIEVYCWVYPYD